MAFYVVWDAEITNRPGLEPYVAAVTDTITKHGGRYLVRGAALTRSSSRVGRNPRLS
jgi:uncharacterized protein (DUF1330 family)